ncbi:GFA family protein [Xanthobacter sp. TB0136]|uniref:GFA family protein n=1 Tax=Xanthobacter sp. TB0136 TaxID=3459177 RepID=UPI00403A5D5F
MSGRFRTPIEGGCLCGQVRYRISSVTSAFWCHCTMCRRASGASAVPWASVPRGAFHMVRGMLRQFESSPGVRRGFCGACGSPILFDMAQESEVDITIGTLDQPDALSPTHHIWTGSQLNMSHGLGSALPHHPAECGAKLP